MKPDPSQPLRAAVIGCGAIAHEHLGYLSRSPRVRLVGVCDLSPSLSAFVGHKYGARPFVDVADMLAAEAPDVVHVLTPPHTHPALVRLCLGAGTHVICEKPMAASAEETDALLGEAQAAGRVLQESRNYLFNDVVLQLTDLMEAGELGKVVEVDLLLSLDFLKGPLGDQNLAGPAVALPAGAIHDFLPHLAYLFLHLSGHRGPVDRVRGSLANESGNRRAGYDRLDALVEAGRTRGRLRVASDVQPECFRIYVRGSRGSAEVDLFNPYVRYEGPPYVGKMTSFGQLRSGAKMMRSSLRNLTDKVKQHGGYHGMPRMLDAIYRSIAGSEPPPFSREQMVDTARLSNEIAQLGGQA